MFNGLEDHQIIYAKFDKEVLIEIEKSVKSTKTIAINEISPK